jgi:uncharacterized protein (TIGR02246 family)
MIARTPQQVHEFFTKAILDQDPEGLMTLYDSDAVMLPAVGKTPVRGHAAIREALSALHALNAYEGKVETVFCLQRDDLAMMRSKWHFTGTGSDGQPVRVTGNGAEVMRRKPDGSWVHLIDHPGGADLSE